MEGWQILSLPPDLAQICAASKERVIAKTKGTRYRGKILIHSRPSKDHPIGAILASATLLDVEKKADNIYEWNLKKIERLIEIPIEIRHTFSQAQLEAGIIDLMRLPATEEQIQEAGRKMAKRLLQGEDPEKVVGFTDRQKQKLNEIIAKQYEQKARKTQRLIALLLAATVALGIYEILKAFGIL